MTADRDRAFAGRAAFVTGASRNIGRAVALELARGGADIAIGTRAGNEDANRTVELIEACGRRSIIVEADLSDPAAGAKAAAQCRRSFGRLDVLVNNAALRSDTPIAEISVDEWRSVTGSILDAAFFTLQATLPLLRESDRAAVVNIGGVAGHVGIANRAHVAAAKAAVSGLSRALAAELAPEGITVNCISPGRIETLRSGHVPQHFLDRPTPLGRGGEPEEVAALVAFLAGSGGRYMTGQTLQLNGGWHMN